MLQGCSIAIPPALARGMQGWLLFEALCPGACNLFPRLWPMSAAAAASGDAEEQLLAQLQVQQRAATSLRSLTRPSAGCSHRTAHANSKASSRRGAVLQRVVSAAAYGSVVSSRVVFLIRIGIILCRSRSAFRIFVRFRLACS